METSKFLNDDIAVRIAQHPDRFVGLATLPLQAPLLAVEELKRVAVDLKFSGIQIGSHVNQWNLDEPALHPVYKTAEDLGLAIFVHPWDMDTAGGRLVKYWMPWLVGMPSETAAAICSILMGNILDLFPRLKFCFAHGGGAFPFTVGRITHGHQVRPDLCATNCKVSPQDYLGRFYTDSLVHDAKALDYLISVIGEDKVILGSDYPFPLGESHPGQLTEEAKLLGSDLKERILWRNAVEFLGLDRVVQQQQQQARLASA
ncbi:unnamed protein product [Notodromas monacha]|nr:unnamed protein product [Notodromas monacha]CAG0913367.1 unnamed protein product [Notodromas monacha]